jgi:hypothetical protein
MVLRIFLRVIAQTLQTHSPGAAHMDKAGLHIGAIAFIHRFGSSLNEHVHFHVCVVDGVFEEVEGEGDADATPRISSPGVIFHAATGIDAATVAPVQTTLQKRILRAFVARGLLENCDAKDMLGYKHSGFSVDAGVASKPTTALRWSGCCAIALLRASTVFHGAPTQRGKQTGVPLCQTAQRAHQ